ncbi:uncharacterized protein MJAP1_000456 [Malassezia japonica]|uniref:WD40 repeat-like protein n=1 Tax=Malassezia japonica TaxID=223818 RepID=A0AAF0J8C5_9BASI|nr:uncharacterized protein MJAP1_000456 [Malassezia japonica]WFD37512.1 hypothetical protein MJAP1_000456 [Malassezia japonica]
MSERESDTYEDAPEGSTSGSIDDLVRDTDHLAEIVASQALPESEYDDDYIDDDDDDYFFDDAAEEEDEFDEDDYDEVDDDDGLDPDNLQGHAGMFFLETEGADGNLMERHVRHLSLRELQQLLTYGMASFEPDDPLSDSDHEASGIMSRWRRDEHSGSPADLWEPIKEPVRAGLELQRSGDFGMPWMPSLYGPRNLSSQIAHRKMLSRVPRKGSLAPLVPNSKGVIVAQYPAPCYSGQYSEDSSFFYTCTRDMRVHIYDTSQAPRRQAVTVDDSSVPYGLRSSLAFESPEQITSLNLIQTLEARRGQWTITDVNISPDNQWIVYSSISPYVGLSPVRPAADTNDPSSNQVTLDFSANAHDSAGIWSLRFSGDSREIIAGSHYGFIYVYDIEAQRRVLSVAGHDDDVNSVTFADAASSNVFVSGSDDAMLKVWDRRSLVRGKPAGSLPGHTEGITYISPKGDGRYCISNSKDQSVRLWDLRNLRSTEAVERWAPLDYGLRNWDYRYMPYRRPRYYSHPEDCSVMTYRGHSVLRQQYIYSGSADGRIHIWSLDGNVVQVIDRNDTHPLHTGSGDLASDPSAPEWDLPAAVSYEQTPRSNSGFARARRMQNGNKCIVRDVSWHSGEPTLMSTSWDGSDGQLGSIAQHEWKGPEKQLYT